MNNKIPLIFQKKKNKVIEHAKLIHRTILYPALSSYGVNMIEPGLNFAYIGGLFDRAFGSGLDEQRTCIRNCIGKEIGEARVPK